MRNRIRLSESQLNRAIKEMVKNVLNEMAYGVDLDDTLAWVKKKKPGMSPSAQMRIAQNIINKKKREAAEEENYSKQHTIDGHWIDGQTMLANGKTLTVCHLTEIETRYDVAVMFGVYIDNKLIGYMVNFSPMVISPSLEKYIEDIKRAIPDLEHLFFDGIKIDYEGRYNYYGV